MKTLRLTKEEYKWLLDAIKPEYRFIDPYYSKSNFHIGINPPMCLVTYKNDLGTKKTKIWEAVMELVEKTHEIEDLIRKSELEKPAMYIDDTDAIRHFIICSIVHRLASHTDEEGKYLPE